MKISSALSFALASVLAVGCVNAQNASKELPLNRATIVAGSDEPIVRIEGLPSKASGAAIGSALGAGAGAGVGIISCIGAGFLFPACIGIVVPTTMAAFAVGGGVYGAVATQSTDDVEARRKMLTDVLGKFDSSQRLAALVQQKTIESLSGERINEEKVPNSAESGWTVQIVMSELATIGTGTDSPYALKASARVEVSSSAHGKPLLVKDFRARSLSKLSTAEWRANSDEQVETALEYLLSELANDIFNDLMSVEQHRKGVTYYSKPLKDSDVFDSKGDNSHNDITSSLFDDKTGIDWRIIASGPVDLGTAQIMCGSLTTDDSKKYRVPSLQEFEQLWKEYRDDGRTKIFNQKEYITSDKDSLTRFGYGKTFSFQDGASGNLLAAYLACVSK